MTKKITKVTPTHTFDWYVKWASTLFIMAGLAMRAADYNTILDMMLTLNGTIGWLVVSILWHDRALMLMNAAATTLLLMGILSRL